MCHPLKRLATQHMIGSECNEILLLIVRNPFVGRLQLLTAMPTQLTTFTNSGFLTVLSTHSIGDLVIFSFMRSYVWTRDRRLKSLYNSIIPFRPAQRSLCRLLGCNRNSFEVIICFCFSLSFLKTEQKKHIMSQELYQHGSGAVNVQLCNYPVEPALDGRPATISFSSF